MMNLPPAPPTTPIAVPPMVPIAVPPNSVVAPTNPVLTPSTPALAPTAVPNSSAPIMGGPIAPYFAPPPSPPFTPSAPSPPSPLPVSTSLPSPTISALSGNGTGNGSGNSLGSTRSDFLEFLISKNILTEAQATSIRLDAAQSGKTFEAALAEKGLLSDLILTREQAAFHHLPFVNLEDVGVSPESLSAVPESIARRYNLLPFAISKTDRTLSVAMRNPLDLTAIDFVEKKTGYKLLPNFATPSQIDEKISERYAQNISSEVSEALKETASGLSQNLGDLSALSKEVIREAPITKIVETILGFAIQARASDVHIEPLEDRTRVRYRIDGILAEKLILPRNVHEALVSRIKILSELKIDEKRVPQDGRSSFSANGQTVDLRISTLPTVHGEKIVMRLLSKNVDVPSLSDLGLRGVALKNMEEAIRVPHGIILITGPTGSGKTTTLYSILHKVNTPKVNIVTLEDPVEYEMAGINQVQINPQAGLTFASGLRAFLRQDPNIIMVGEVRDSETAELAIQASLTGHLVFSTLHTSSAAGALPRLLDMGAEPFLLASSITLCASQRVVRKLNADFKEEYTAEPETTEEIRAVLGPLFDAWCAQNKKDPQAPVTLYRSRKDRPETEPEYQGRIAIFEVLRMNEEIGRMIIEHKPAADIEHVGVKNGTILMKQDGYLKALEGITTLEEVLRVAEI